MIHENIELTGSFSVTGSLTLPNYPTSASYPNAITGSMYNDTGLNAVRFYDGVQWQTLVSGSVAETPADPASADIEYLVVAGGGGAAADSGGGAGGGAGGLLSSSLSSMESGSSITVTIGGGGAGYVGGTSPAGDGTDSSIASAGGTSFTTVTSTGGGGAGSSEDTGTIYLGHDGGSGGGSGNGNASYTRADGGSGTVGQGNDGGGAHSAGVNNGNNAAGGGGGAGAVGADAASGAGGNGGDGLQSSITGTSTYYAGGGAGGTRSSGTAGTGGQGGGGDANNTTNGTGQDGDANTGGGAGGSRSTPTAAGGSGVVILAYPTGSVTGQGGVKTSRSDGYFVHQFNSSGTFTLGGANDYPAANNSVFAPILYTGNGANSDGGKVVTGLNFQPDLMLLKNRSSSGENWAATDVVSGFGKILYPNLSNAQAGSTDTYFTANADGFDVNTNNLNVNTHNYVAWCWKAGGSSTSDGSGDVTADVSANTSAGFSIVKYNDGGTNNQTAAHGLDQAPELIITKETSSNDWIVYFTVIDDSMDFVRLNTTAAKSDSSLTAPTADYIYTRGSSSDIVNYCFHSVAGYQKIGSYTGNGSNTGPEVTTGFQPRFLLIKDASEANSWTIHDSVRDTSNPRVKYVLPNAANAEASDLNGIDFNSDGFQPKDDYQYYNKNNNTYIYLAIG